MANTETIANPPFDNPLVDSPERDQRIRDRAYHLWEADGCPHGHDVAYWERARALIGMEDSPHAGERPNPATLPGADPDRTAPVEEAFLQENLGEFPGIFTDQGDRQPTPGRPSRGDPYPSRSDP